MNHSKTRLSCLFCMCFALLVGQTTAQTPAPAPNVSFAIPLTDKTTATAIVLPGPNTQAWLVYATPSGKLGLWILTPTSPTPQPEPPPPVPTPPPDPPPTPPPVDGPFSLITVTETTPATLPPAVAAFLTKTNSTYCAYTVAMVELRNPPPGALLWIGRTAGKTYPYSVVVRADQSIRWQGPTPQSQNDWLKLWEISSRPGEQPACDGPTCKPTRLKRNR